MVTPLSALKTVVGFSGLMLLSGLCKAQTTGISYGQSGSLSGLHPNRTQSAGIFAEQPLGKHFSLATGANYLWRREVDNGPFPLGCFPPPGEIIPIARWEQKMRMLEVPLDAGFRLSGTSAAVFQRNSLRASPTSSHCGVPQP